MKKRAKGFLITLSTLSLVVYLMLSMFFINRQALDASRQSLDNFLYSTVALADIPKDDPQGFVKALAGSYSSDVRITLIALDGTVLGDSASPPAGLPNHLDREEVRMALESGIGEAVRNSPTTGEQTMYQAILWEDTYILRFSIPVSASREFGYKMFPLLVATFIVLSIIIISIVDRFSRKLAEPYERMLLYIESVLDKEKSEFHFTPEYEEMQPIVRYFEYLLDQISTHIQQITSQSAEIENIICNMGEGLVLLDDQLEILLINPQGSKFLSIPPDCDGKKITYLYRNQQFIEAVEHTQQQRKRSVIDILHSGNTYRLYCNPVPEGGLVLLISDVTELIRLERVRSDFVANVSHELKTPLTSISGFAELIEVGMVSDPSTIQDYAKKIHVESLRLVQLIDDILKLSTIESAKMEEAPVESADVDVRAIFDYVLQLLDAQIKEKNIAVSISGSLQIHAPQQHIHELALNLCDNAVKYNKDGGRMDIVLTESGFSVSDTGIGIPPEHQSRIFERFYRVDKGRSRQTGGTGLGLAIAKHIVVQLGGSITVESSSEGTTFSVHFQ